MSYETWATVLAIIVIIFIMGILFFIYYRERTAIKLISHKTGSFTGNVVNKTSYTFDLITSSTSIKIPPNVDKNLVFGLHEPIRAESVTENGTKLQFDMTPSAEFTKLYITNGGFGTGSETNPNVKFVNTSQDDILFALVSKYGGSAFPVLVKGKQTIEGNVVVKGDTWQAVKPARIPYMIASTVIRIVPTSVTFDGRTLTVN